MDKEEEEVADENEEREMEDENEDKDLVEEEVNEEEENEFDEEEEEDENEEEDEDDDDENETQPKHNHAQSSKKNVNKLLELGRQKWISDFHRFLQHFHSFPWIFLLSVFQIWYLIVQQMNSRKSPVLKPSSKTNPRLLK